MSTAPHNPFVLPGMGQGPELAGNPLLASMEMMRQAWSSLAGAGGLAQSMPMTPPLSLDDLERRITDLRTVENWLQMNLSLLSSTIQGLEVQRATIATLRSFADGMAAPASGASGGAGDASPLEVLLGIRPAGKGAAQPKAQSAGSRAEAPAASSPFGAPRSAPAAAAQASAAGAGDAPDTAATSSSASAASSASADKPAADPMASASQAWWNLLNQQFDQIAQATAASMPSAAPKPAAAGKGAGASKTAAKTASGAATAPAAKKAAKPAAKSAAKTSSRPAAKRAPARKRAAPAKTAS